MKIKKKKEEKRPKENLGQRQRSDTWLTVRDKDGNIIMETGKPIKKKK